MLYNLFENRDFVSVFAVALLAEGVDRNHKGCSHARQSRVALLAEGVDRNLDAFDGLGDDRRRPPRGGRG